MSNDTNEETYAEPVKAAKKAAKKAPAKKAAKKAAARKSAKKVSDNQSEIALLIDVPAAPPVAKKTPAAKEAPAETPAAKEPAVKVARPRKVAAKKAVAAPVEEARPAPAPQPAPAPESTPSAGESDQPRRFGRVPGGGPTTQREVSESSAPPAAAPAVSEERERPQQPQHGGEGNESRSKRRREKRKRRREQNRNEREGQGGGGGQQNQNRHERRDGQQRNDRDNRHRNDRNDRNDRDPNEDRHSNQLSGEKIEIDGMLELAPKGFGFLRVPKKNFEQARDDVFVTPEIIRKNHLRLGQWIHGLYQQGPRGPQLVEITTINGMPVDEASKLPHFDELKAVNPSKRISFETTPERFTTRVVDIMAPVGRGQRGLIVSPPRSGKTTLLLHMAEAIRTKYEENMHLMVLLIDERPEEVTEFRRALPGAEIYASSNDENARSHCRIAELAIERAKRLVEAGKDVFLLMDSITRLARAYNGNMNNRGRGTGSGGITIGALEVPRRLFAAARNTRGGGSLTILATALIQTNSRADEAIFMEFKGTGNMELVLDRKIAENYIYPAVDIFKSGTRREELLLPEHMLHKIHLIRRGLSGHRPVEAMERLLYFLKKFPNNPQMLLEIKG
ncbi:MAG TPA: transcription termination factor Rho [Luteolibacter sp.]|nr:transcription termination factor Rho [Luteolibacter sp.]